MGNFQVLWNKKHCNLIHIIQHRDMPIPFKKLKKAILALISVTI